MIADFITLIIDAVMIYMIALLIKLLSKKITTRANRLVDENIEKEESFEHQSYLQITVPRRKKAAGRRVIQE